MNNALDRVIAGLQAGSGGDGITTTALAERLALSRSVVSHYLNQLHADGRVTKLMGRPVRWQIAANTECGETVDPFTDFIGVNGSLHGVLAHAAAAVTYPPHGLNILITGASGTGKSYLAKVITDYARAKAVIAPDAPYVVLNCADYANNPELLSSILFGYVRGAFTGADQDKDGLLHQADQGYLFLDEVHRLSSENQEKLFSFIDSGQFYRMGDNTRPQRAKVRLILATTETPDKVLLATFRRRIPVALHLPSYHRRPLDERLGLLHTLLLKEAQKMQRVITVTPTVVAALLQIDHPGNIGYLKNTLQVGCATAYSQQPTASTITLDLSVFQFARLPAEVAFSPLVVDPQSSAQHHQTDQIAGILDELTTRLAAFDEDWAQAVQRQWMNDLQSLAGKIPTWELNIGFHLNHQRLFTRVIQKQFGLTKTAYLEPLLFVLYRRHFQLDEKTISHLHQQIKLRMPRALHVAHEFYRVLAPLAPLSQQTLVLVLALMLSDHVDEAIQLRGLMVAHGENTATSIQAVVNTLCGTYVFDAIDMPIATGVTPIITETTRLIDESDTTRGFILLVDMGSLSQLYSSIKSHLNGDLLVVNNLTTVTALDLGLRMQQRLPFKEIAEKADQDYTISAQYFEGFSQTTNILVSCISGLGIAEKIREIMQPLMPSDIKVIPVDYTALTEKIVAEEWEYFDRTLFVLTTMDLRQDLPVANLNIYELLDATGVTQLSEWLAPYLEPSQLKHLNDELLRFFSIEGISERLSFLNPSIVIKQVEAVITKYENYYHLSLDGKIKLNLYMHIALMIERLMVRKPVETPIQADTDQESEFLRVSRSVFQPIELKYNIRVSDYELSLMYELFKQFLSV